MQNKLVLDLDGVPVPILPETLTLNKFIMLEKAAGAASHRYDVVAARDVRAVHINLDVADQRYQQPVDNTLNFTDTRVDNHQSVALDNTVLRDEQSINYPTFFLDDTDTQDQIVPGKEKITHG